MSKRRSEDKIINMQHVTEKQADGKTTKESKKYQIVVSQEPSYVKLYLNTLLTFKDLPKQMSAILLQLLRRITFADPEKAHGGQLIVLNKFVKEEIINQLGIKMNTLDQCLTKLVKSGILRRVGLGTYQANPYMFGMGNWSAIKAIRATFDFNQKTVEAEIETASPITVDEYFGVQIFNKEIPVK